MLHVPSVTAKLLTPHWELGSLILNKTEWNRSTHVDLESCHLNKAVPVELFKAPASFRALELLEWK